MALAIIKGRWIDINIDSPFYFFLRYENSVFHSQTKTIFVVWWFDNSTKKNDWENVIASLPTLLQLYSQYTDVIIVYLRFIYIHSWAFDSSFLILWNLQTIFRSLLQWTASNGKDFSRNKTSKIVRITDISYEMTEIFIVHLRDSSRKSI